MAVISITAFSCNSLRKQQKKENKAISLVRGSNTAIGKLKPFFRTIDPCIIDTIKLPPIVDSFDYKESVIAFNNTIEMMQDYGDSLQNVLNNLPEPVKENCNEYQIQIDFYKNEFVKLANEKNKLKPIIIEKPFMVKDVREIQSLEDSLLMLNGEKNNWILRYNEKDKESKLHKKATTKWGLLFFGSWILYFAIGYFIRKFTAPLKK
jgi:hypothetical protein